ncbi:MAG: hypothetical protein ACLQQ4_08895 [Bacteroidia bacterium]
MKRLRGYILVIFMLAFNDGKSNPGISYSDTAFLSSNDSDKKHEVLITPGIGYSELPILESPMNYVIFYNNEHNLTTSPELVASLDYLVTDDIGMGLAINYQLMPFTSLSIKQPYFYPYPLYPYSYYASSEFGCSLDHLADNNVNAGLAISYQTMQCKSLSAQQAYYPYSMQFNCFNFGIRKLFYLKSIKINNLYFYIGGIAELSIWKEVDNWGSVTNNQYDPVINYENTLQINLLLLGGVKYFFINSIGMQLELGYGFGTPYYAQLGIIIRLHG